MTNLLHSTFETYLLDEEVEMEHYEERSVEQVEYFYREQYPPGFFSSL
ncbi:hypothetical protein [Solibacillus sp. FSL H8-0538]